MTDKTEGINEISGRSFIELNTKDAERLGISNGDRVKVTSRRGAIDSVDNICSTPEYKVCAVRVEKLGASA